MGRPRPDLDFDPVQWDTGDWARFRFAGMTLSATNTYAQTETADGIGGIRRGRLTHVSGAEGNDRRMYLLDGQWAIDNRIRTVWWSRPLAAAGSAQVGHVHRVRLDDPDGWARGWIVDHDFAFGTTANIRANSWRWNPSGVGVMQQVEEIGVTLAPLQRLVTATDAVRAGGTVTASGLSPANGEPGGLVAGHTISATFPGDASYNGIHVVATAVAGATTATWAQAVADDPGAGAGTLDDLDGVMPLAIESELVDDTLTIRAWRLGPGQAEPSWSDPTHAVKLQATAGADPYPQRAGRSGLYVGHLVGAGDFVEWGSFENGRYR